jgi:ribosomal protein L14E/L6E/L27E
MGRRGRDGNHSPQRNNSIEDSEEMKKMNTHFLTPTKTKINITKEPSDTNKKKKNFERGNLGRNHGETHGKDTGHG